MRHLRPAILALLLAALPAVAQQAAPWHDPSPHKVQFVTVDKDVKLEALDWGGTGRPVVLLAGASETAHVFDDFAPKLTSEYHVYAITRRGFGASSVPAPDAINYSADRLGDDVLAVLDALTIDKPVLVGHSLGGEELTSVVDRHPGRVAGLVYLDAGYTYAYYNASLTGDPIKNQIDWDELKRKAESVLSGEDKTRQQSIEDLLNADLPAFQKDLQEFGDSQSNPLPPSPPRGTPADRESFSAYRAYYKRTFGLEIPEAELREEQQLTSDGHVGPPKDVSPEDRAILAGLQRYTEIKAPVLAIFASPHGIAPYAQNDPAFEKFYADDVDYMKRVTASFKKGVPSARVVLLPNADHYVFLSNEADVLREMRAFIEQLP